MVKKGLKIGETFVDGGLTYEVLGYDKDGNYISTRKVDEIETVAEPSVKRTRKKKGE